MINTRNANEVYATLENANSRRVILPKLMETAGVESDENVRTLKFKFPKIVDGADLTEMQVRINYMNSRGEKGQHIVDDLKPYESDESYVTFSWPFSRMATRYRGLTKFIVCAVKAGEDGDILTEWNTALAQIRVLEGLEVTAQDMTPDEEDVIAQLISTVEKGAKRAETAAKAAEDAAQTAQIPEKSLASKQNKRNSNCFYNLDLLKKIFESETAYSFEDIEIDYNEETGKEWVNIISSAISVPKGEYTLIMPNVVQSEESDAWLEYEGGKDDASLRIFSTKNAYSCTKVTVNKEIPIEIRLRVSGAQVVTYGIYGIYNAFLVTGDYTWINKETFAAAFQVDEKLRLYGDKILYRQYGKNLFNREGATPNTLINSAGKEFANASYFAAPYTPIEANTQYVYSQVVGGGSFNAFYDKDLNFISSIQNNVNPLVFTTPENCAYIRLSGGYAKDNQQLEKGGTPTEYEPFTEYMPLLRVAEQTEKNTQDIENLNLKEPERYISVSGDLTAQSPLLLEENHIKTNKRLMLSAKVRQMGTFRLCFGKTEYGAAYLEISQGEIKQYAVTGTAALKQTYNFSLDISEDLQILLSAGEDEKALMRICSQGQWEEIELSSFSGSNGTIKAESETAEFTDCTLSFTCDGYHSDIQMYGDSYFGTASAARWPYYLVKDGRAGQVLLDGYSGKGSAGGIKTFNINLTHSIPKYAVWCLGMNDPDTSSEINANWKKAVEEFLSVCDKKGIIPVLSTIPTVKGGAVDDTDISNMRINKFKNQYVRSSGRRYIDFDAAVGADEETGEWYGGMLSGDGVHPTEQGAKALYMRVLTDFPEVMIL